MTLPRFITSLTAAVHFSVLAPGSPCGTRRSRRGEYTHITWQHIAEQVQHNRAFIHGSWYLVSEPRCWRRTIDLRASAPAALVRLAFWQAAIPSQLWGDR